MRGVNPGESYNFNHIETMQKQIQTLETKKAAVNKKIKMYEQKINVFNSNCPPTGLTAIISKHIQLLMPRIGLFFAQKTVSSLQSQITALQNPTNSIRSKSVKAAFDRIKEVKSQGEKLESPKLPPNIESEMDKTDKTMAETFDSLKLSDDDNED